MGMRCRTAHRLIKCKRLFEARIVTRVLFLVDRIALARQAEDAFTDHLRDYPCHVLQHFDSLQFGLTATPWTAAADALLDTEDGRFVRDTLRFIEFAEPTFRHDLRRAIKEGHRVPCHIRPGEPRVADARRGRPHRAHAGLKAEQARWAGLIGSRVRADAPNMENLGEWDFDAHPFAALGGYDQARGEGALGQLFAGINAAVYGPRQARGEAEIPRAGEGVAPCPRFLGQDLDLTGWGHIRARVVLIGRLAERSEPAAMALMN